MKTRLFLSAVLAALIIVLSGCGVMAAPVKAGQADDGKPISMKVGQKLEVTLPGNPSTGYTWILKSVDETIVDPNPDKPAFKQGGPSGAVGAGGTVTWTFLAASAGSTSLHLEYKRPWETTATPAQTWSAPITVK